MKKNFDIENFIKKIENSCKLSQTKTFQKDEIITTYIFKRNQLCILLEGEAQLISYDKNGNKKIIYFLNKNDIFGEALYKLPYNKALFVLAKQQCKVLFLPYDTIENCNKDCIFHIELLKNLPDLILSGIAKQNTRILILASKGVRERLMIYFDILINEHSSNTFDIPFSLTDLADYLMLERTSMMREFKRLQDEKIILKNKNKITIL